VGGRSRYDKDRPVDDREADEARAYHTLGELVSHRSSLELDARTRRALSEVLHATAIELSAGRAVPIGLRRAVKFDELARHTIRLAAIRNPAPSKQRSPSQPVPLRCSAIRRRSRGLGLPRWRRLEVPGGGPGADGAPL
jgi:hypothetical protein